MLDSSGTSRAHPSARPSRPVSSVAAVLPLFSLGQVVATHGALDLLQAHGVQLEHLLARHVRGDWGIVSADDARQNERSLAHGWRLMSVYPIGAGEIGETGGSCLWIITEADRSVTTFLLPSEY